MVGRFKDGTPQPQTGQREDLTTPEGWRIDWPDDTPFDVPFLDNAPNVEGLPDLSDPWTPGAPGHVNDPPAVERYKETFVAHTCFVGTHRVHGDKKLLGCVKWGFTLNKVGRRAGGHTTREAAWPEMSIIEGTPEPSCYKPQGFGDAVDLWNKTVDKEHQIPDILDPWPHQHY
jgi:hypothetical protein